MIRLQPFLRALSRVAYFLLFTGLLLALSFGSAGIVAMWSHPPGTAGRAELTWHGDSVLGKTLDGSQVDLTTIGADMDRLGVLARGAIGALTADDQTPFAAALAEGSGLTRKIESDSSTLRSTLSALPGSGPLDVLTFSSAVVARTSAMLSAVDATRGVARSWVTLTSGSLQASSLIELLVAHDATVGRAAAQGRAADYPGALITLDDAMARLDEATVIRNRLVNTTDVSTLDQWIQRNREYDEVLVALYAALRDSGGVINEAVRIAYRNESQARANLPPDTRGLVVIIADIGQGGLNQAVISIGQARVQLDLAIQRLATP